MDHEFGHTFQFIILSMAGKNPWIPYLGLGLAGITFEQHAEGLLPIIGCGFEKSANVLGMSSGSVMPCPP